MTYVRPTAQNMATRLGDGVDTARAEALLADAELLCLDVVSPLPDTAAIVVMAAAIRAYSNITGATAEAAGQETVQHGPSGSGVYLTKNERAVLKRAFGQGGAFTIDTLGPDHPVLTYWLQVVEDPFAEALQAGGGFPGDWPLS